VRNQSNIHGISSTHIQYCPRNMANVARELLKKQFVELTRDDSSGFSVGLDDDSNWFKWRVCFEGPPDTLYEGGIFTAVLSFPEDFPNNPPDMKFEQEMLHPNIYPDGRVCISILHPPGTDRYNEQESADERWRPILGVESILVSVISMLGEPNLDSAANIDAASCNDVILVTSCNYSPMRSTVVMRRLHIIWYLRVVCFGVAFFFRVRRSLPSIDNNVCGW